MNLNIPLLHHYDAPDGVTAFSTTRQGGSSCRTNYRSFNINAYCGDDEESIAANRQSLCDVLHIAPSRLVMPHQTHGDSVRLISEDFFSLSPATQQMLLEGVDAVMTNLPDTCIGVSTADCIPILLYDTEHGSMAAVHAGWRGTLQRIVLKVVAEMKQCFHTSPSSLCAYLGPGISLENFEVGDEVYDAFAQAGFKMQEIATRYKKWHIDLFACNQLQLQSAGVLSENIHVSGICTYDHVDEFFSARRLGVESGRIFTGIMRR